ncbi:hypothetical protein OK18_01950 [Chryseobacterium gallinarum]|uniref:Uncharacterized protein n=1 Tax=Chryseobacterium gallinarum TaxID=1324352 RepID=A0A0G3LXB7_CHRGL|nr:hypothetical protein OK18_01950 [Chryseobacterium gallinarum]
MKPRIEKKRNAEKLLFATILLLLKKDFRHHIAPFWGFLFSQTYKFTILYKDLVVKRFLSAEINLFNHPDGKKYWIYVFLGISLKKMLF